MNGMLWVIVGGCLCVAVIMLGVLACFGSGGGTWVKRDGTIIEWDGRGNGKRYPPC